MFKILNEYKSLFFAFLIIVIVNVIAYVSFQKISAVSDKISLTLKNETPASLVAKQLMIELRTAENYARAYYLTDDKESLRNYYKTTSSLQQILAQLNNYDLGTDNALIDSITHFSKLMVYSLKSQSYLNNPKQVVGELDELSKKIDILYTQPTSTANAVSVQVKQDSIKKKEGFLKRMFSRKKKTKVPEKPVTSETPVDNNVNQDVKGELKVAVSTAKNSQSKIITANRKSEYELSTTVFTYREQINSLIELLRLHEDARKAGNTKIATDELRKLKIFTLATTALLSLFLLALIYFIYVYNKKKVQYVAMLDGARKEAENLAMAKESFLNNMSHEIKTPLNAIQGFSEVLANSAMNTEQKKQITIIKNSATYLSKLINNILSNARLNSGKTRLNPVEVNIINEIKDIVILLQQQALNKGFELKLDVFDCKVTTLIIDIDKLKQILFNLLGNAIKFTSAGHVLLKVMNSSDEVPALIMEIKDTGIGIKEETLPNLFQEFEQGGEQTQATFGGTGLGLVITKKTVLQLGGKISIESKFNAGTTVRITIPYQPANKNPEQEKKQELFDLNYLKDKKILVVDDEEYNRLLLRAVLAEYNPFFVEAKNGKEAITAAASEAFDLIIMDIRMPELNGIEATQEIRKQHNMVPILGATAVMNEEKIARCTQAGMNDIIFKPFSKAELAIKLEQIFNPQHNKQSKANEKTVSNEPSINFKGIIASTQGDEPFRKELILVFHKSLNDAVVQINKLFDEGKYDMMGERAHKIIPSCKHFETHRLLTALRFFEQTSNSSPIDIAKYNLNLALMNEETELINQALTPYLN